MPSTPDRETDLLSMSFAILFAVAVLVIPDLFPLLFVSGFIALAVAVNEAIRRLDAYANG